MHPTPTPAESKPQLKRALGPWDLTFLSVVAIANLNLVPVIAASGPITVWLWLAALVFFLLPQGITVIELAHRHPAEGSLYVWTKDAFGDFHGFMAAGPTGPPTCSTCPRCSSTWAAFWPTPAPGASPASALLNIRGIGVGKWVNNSGGWVALPASSFAIRGLDWSIMSSFGVICFGLVGLELGPVMGDEIRDPERSVPQGTFRGGMLAGLVYLLARSSSLSRPEPDRSKE
jgi:glutamate:GABA antiporter